MPNIEPLERLTPKGRAPILFVLPWLRRDFDIDIDGTPEAKQFFKLVGKVIPNYAAVTLKQTPGMWKDSELDEQLAKRRVKIDEYVARYKPACIVFMGVNFAKMMNPDIRHAKHDLKGTFCKYKMVNNKTVMSMVWGAPDTIIKDTFEFVRMPETLSKLRLFADRMHYDRKPDITNLDTFRQAREYIDFLAYEHAGNIGFDTETYSLNRVNHCRLGSMQFCHNDTESAVLLWDSKHQALSKQEMTKLVPHLQYLFGSTKTKFDAWLMHNAQFDIMQIFAAFGSKFPKTIFDTMLFAHLLDENRLQTARVWLPDRSGPYSLKVLVQEFLAFFHYSDEAMKARSSGVLMDLPLPEFLEYSGFDPSVTYRLFEALKLWAKYEKYDETVMRLMRNLHSHAVKMYAHMSRTGFNIDEAKLRQLLDKKSIINSRLTDIKEEYKTIAEIQHVNKELAEGQAQSNMFFRVPWIFDMDSQSHRGALFFHSKKGFKYQANEDGKFSTDKKFQKANAKNRAVELFTEAQGLVKLRNAYIKPIFENLFNNPNPDSDVSDGRVHSEYLMARTVTGRVACIAKGTKVEVLRNVAKHPKGINIENVRVGDLAYCYDKNGRPTLRPVEAVTKTGHRDVIRIHWQGAGHRHKGHLDLTPEHRVRLTSGKYVRADSLTAGDRIMALSRDFQKSCRLYFTGSKACVTEHRFVWETINKKKIQDKLHVHHKDWNHKNNVPSNLELLTSSEHAKLHGQHISAATRKKHSENMKLRHKLTPQIYPTGKDAHNYQDISRYSLLRLLFRCGGRPSYCSRFGYDFSTFVSKLDSSSINWSAIAFRFGRDGSYISKSRLVSFTGIPAEQVAKELRIGTRRLKDLHVLYDVPYGTLSKKSYKLSKSDVIKNATEHRAVVNNHEVIKISRLRKSTDVYDLSIKGCHNFIANEICVHNCKNPNSQQVPRSDSPVKKEIKSLFIPEDGKILIQADLSAAEVRVWGALSGDEQICRLSQEAMILRKKVRDNPDDKKLRDEAELKADFHKQTYGLCYNKSPADVSKPERQDAKKISFGLLYGMSLNGLCRELGKEPDVVQEIMNRFFNVYKTGAKWLTDTQDFALAHGYVETPLGRRRRMPQVFTGDKASISEAKRFAVNAPIQATASDYAMLSTCLLDMAITEAGVEDDVKLVNAVHDSVVLEVTATAEWVQYVAKLVRRVFTKDVVSVLKRDFDFELKAPIDIDIEVSQHYMHKCKKCGNKQYPGVRDTCSGEIKTGEKKPDGSDAKVKCGHTKFERIDVNGWGYLMALEENSKGIAAAMKGIKINTKSGKATKPEKAKNERNSKTARLVPA